MASQLPVDRLSRFEVQLSTFEVRTWPPPAELGQALERNARLSGSFLQLRFDGQAAGFSIADSWSMCCELLLQAQLAREARLDHFVLDVERIFSLSYLGGLLFCAFSKEHVFAVPREGFAAALERVVSEVFAATSCPRLMHIAARWGASAIRAQPYSHRFSESVLT